ncbi:MAG: YARHG domain-containing protein [Pyrinomonadaceae bacterium]
MKNIFGLSLGRGLVLPFFLLIFVVGAFANDGVFYVQGNNLVPLQETQVRLKKEVLRFYVTDFGWMRVDVDFTFVNPGKSKKVTVGFVTPPASGDTDEEQHPQIKDFDVNVNGTDVKYQMKRMNETSFAGEKLGIESYDFVYYFPVTFKSGENKIKHTYTYRGGASVETQRDFYYQITTGKRWANKQIDDFTLELHLDNGIYMIPASFWESGKLAQWKIVGDGVMKEEVESRFYDEDPRVRMVHLNSGYITFQAKNFRPDRDITFAEPNWPAGWIGKWCIKGSNCVDSEALEEITPYFRLNPWEGTTKEDLAQLSEQDLRLIRNFYYAVRGYQFKSDDLKSFYTKFFWYKPVEGLAAESIELTPAEEKFVRLVMSAEAEKQGKN